MATRYTFGGDPIDDEPLFEAIPVAQVQPANTAMSGKELVSYMQRNNFSPAQAAAALGMSEGAILSSVAQTIDPNSSLNLGGTIIQPVYDSRGEGENFQQGNLSEILVYDQNQKTGDPYKTFTPTGQLVGGGKFQDVSNLGEMLQETVVQLAPIILAAATYGAGGSALGSALGLGTGTTATAVGNALIQGAVAEASGGDFLKGAATGAAGAFVPSVNAGISEALGGGTAANIAAGSLTGGVLSNMAGGKFSTGALLGGANAGIGEMRNNLRQEMFDTAMTESGLAGQTETRPSDFFLENPNYENISIAEIIDNLQSFNPDYSLSSPEYAPGLKPSPIDTSNYEIGSYDYSLGNMANANLVDGSGLTVDLNASIGDPNSFINQPPPQINYTLPEFTDLPPVDNSGKLAAFGVAQTLLPAVITAIAADSSAPKEADRPTGFDIVPIPGEWRPPEYNQQFTPSAPIDFGSRELLRGTQFDRPSIRPTQMNYGLSGNQVSIADIIAGIQGQYGQETTS